MPKSCATVSNVPDTVDTALAEALRSRGQRVTPQRLAIARVLREAGGHVTAERVYAEVSERMPGVSLPTVYAALDLLEELGHVRRVATDGGTVVWDSRVEDHHHATCRGCGTIVDVDAVVDPSGAFAAARAAGFRVDHAQVLLVGLCADCRDAG
jgi:Fe2+ or Zn2+ uptake regulation protein